MPESSSYYNSLHLIADAVSFTYNSTNRGPSSETCGTPQVTHFGSDIVSPMSVTCLCSTNQIGSKPLYSYILHTNHFIFFKRMV